MMLLKMGHMLLMTVLDSILPLAEPISSHFKEEVYE